MARSRILKAEFFRSRSLSRCSVPARLTFQGLWAEADDAGRGIADPRVLKGSIWPLDDDVTPAVIMSHLEELTETGHVRLYASAEETYYHVLNWEKHQAAAYRRGNPKYPDPDDSGSCTPLHADACKKVLEAARREVNGKEAAAAPARVDVPIEPATALAAADAFDEAINAAVEIRRSQAEKITRPDRWEPAVRTALHKDFGHRIRKLLDAGHPPADAAAIALGQLPASTQPPGPARISYIDAAEYGATIARSEVERGDPYDPIEFMTICGARGIDWVQAATRAYATGHGKDEAA